MLTSVNFLSSEKWDIFSKGKDYLDFAAKFPMRTVIVHTKYTFVFFFFFFKNSTFSLSGGLLSGVGVVLRLRTNTVRTEHRTFLQFIDVRVITNSQAAIERVSEDSHHYGNVDICTHCTIRTYVH
jgi:hypothetical protein